MTQIIQLFLGFSIFLAAVLQSRSLGDCYWRRYNWTIPKDAIKGGFDINREPIYIGQAVINEENIIVAPIYPNKSFVEIIREDGSVERVNSSVNILCGSFMDADWIEANAGNLHVKLTKPHFVIGGKIRGQYIMVGRIMYENEIKIGPINAFYLESAKMKFNHKGRVLSTRSYEVLLHGSPRGNINPWDLSF